MIGALRAICPVLFPLVGMTKQTPGELEHGENKTAALTCPAQLKAALARSLATMRTDFALVLTAALLVDTFGRNNGEQASKGPCQPGFSQSFYSVLISRDVLQGHGTLKGNYSIFICRFGNY
ncbi:hypothetical protein KUCAC02_012198 [Chaenocephalus aceratus]|uniref:Uncharacterized protein n=1 Tax=Chaenocephalus aceratus TaxID=36190 RepID=A0ACB9XAS5_CHAAC|nr:hypothetical protein KUCAC02_012198 [Chaenocephalus aceratus]